ncbi:nickel-dependent lactate racemase [candidate division KSB1 bacterium]|nr:nickel-dependent lactate racemase [candidate division KSB1 bacterium]
MLLSYGREKREVDLPININWQRLTFQEPSQRADEKVIIQNAIQMAKASIDNLKTTPANVLFIVPDHTRRCKIESILPFVLTLFPSAETKVTILIANGTHELQSARAIKALLGENIVEKYNVIQHDCHDDGILRYVGETRAGTPIWLNRLLLEADFIMTINGILFHYFAGFGGGAKMLLPGAAGYETIRINHSYTIDRTTGQFHNGCHDGNLDTNPVQQDLRQVLDFLPPVLSFQVVLDSSGMIRYADSGPVLQVQKKLCSRVKELYSIPIRERADIVVASAGGYPMDVNFVQSHKSLHHACKAVRKNGHVVLYASCDEGIGSGTILPYLQYSTSREVAEALLKSYKVNAHTALAIKTKAENVNIYLISDLPDNFVHKMGITPVKNFTQAMKKIKARTPLSTGYIMEQANLQVPFQTTA